MPQKKAAKTAKSPEKRSSATPMYAKTSRKDGKGRVVYTRSGKDYTRHKMSDGTFGMRAATGSLKGGRNGAGGGFFRNIFATPGQGRSTQSDKSPEESANALNNQGPVGIVTKEPVGVAQHGQVYTKADIISMLRDTQVRASSISFYCIFNREYNFSTKTKELAEESVQNRLFPDISALIAKVKEEPVRDSPKRPSSSTSPPLAEGSPVGIAKKEKTYTPEEILNMLNDTLFRYKGIIWFCFRGSDMFSEDTVLNAIKSYNMFLPKFQEFYRSVNDDFNTNENDFIPSYKSEVNADVTPYRNAAINTTENESEIGLKLKAVEQELYNIIRFGIIENSRFSEHVEFVGTTHRELRRNLMKLRTTVGYVTNR